MLTTDNPRSENPAAIIEAVRTGVPREHAAKVMCELDRQKAIQLAYQASRPGTIIALLGKGPDEYQIFGTEKRFFSERSILKNL